MEMNMKFKELKKYISILDRVSICMSETLRYENYHCMELVPDKYDELYVCGIGMIESEFPKSDPKYMWDVKDEDISGKYYLAKCIEIILAQKPRNEFSPECTYNEYAYIRTRFPLYEEESMEKRDANAEE